MIRDRLAQVQLAIMLLTRLPAGQLPDPAPGIGSAAWAFPLAGLAVGGGGALTLWAALALGLPPALGAGLAILTNLLLTGALHEDGLADLADGFWGGQTHEKRLEIMRDSRIGSYGTLALIVSIGLRWQALVYLAQANLDVTLVVMVVMAMTSRVAPAAVLAFVPPARSDGLGHSARATPPSGVAIAALIALVPGLLLDSVLLLPVLMAILCQAIVTVGLAKLAQRKLGGQTGDVLGASQQVAEIAGYLALCAVLAL